MFLSLKQCILVFNGVKSKHPLCFLLGTKVYIRFLVLESKGFKNLRNAEMNYSDTGMWGICLLLVEIIN